MLKKLFPPWIKVRYSMNEKYQGTESILKDYDLQTVCQNALCPNQGVCFTEGVATFLMLGNICTRSCRFCGVGKGRAEPPDLDEPGRIAKAVSLMELDHVVITSVTRDDLEDGGARIFAGVIAEIRLISPGTAIEVLTPDFLGNEAALAIITDAGPNVFSHNMETVPRLYPSVRAGADYGRSLKVLAKCKQRRPQLITKSGLMVGLGEQYEEVIAVLGDLRENGCDCLTIGQYLAPSSRHLPVAEFIPPEQFGEYERVARKMGFEVAAGPLVRSSYHAKMMFQKLAGVKNV